jgi:dTDP-glucose 4,6-dehydratase
MRILLAGGSGFIGSHLTDHFLSAGHDVLVVDNFLTGRRSNLEHLVDREHLGRLRVVQADIIRLDHLDGAFDAVVHLASPASPCDYLRFPIETMRAGAEGTRHLLDIARRHNARFLLASTSEVYGDPEIHPQPERYWGNVNPVGPRSVYDEAKRYAEALTSAYGRTYGMPVRIARIFNTYGPRMRIDDGRVVPTFIVQALRSEPLTIQGDGRQTRSYCYVSDLVRGLEALLCSEVEGPTNLGNPEEHTVTETAERIIQLTGSSSHIRFVPAAEDDPRRRKPDISRATGALHWIPMVPLDQGLLATIGYVRTQTPWNGTSVPSPTNGASAVMRRH